MIDITNIWGFILFSSIVFFFGWLLYPIIAHFVAGLLANPVIVRLITIIAVLAALLAAWQIISLFSDGIKPHSIAEAKQEYRRFSRFPQRYKKLAKKWDDITLGRNISWVDSQFDFKQGDYFWVVCIDSCLIKISPFETGSAVIDTVSAACYQAKVNYASIVSFKSAFSLLVTHSIRVKHWSYSKAKTWRQISLYSLISLFLISAFFICFGLEMEIATYKRKQEAKRIKQLPITPRVEEVMRTERPVDIDLRKKDFGITYRTADDMIDDVVAEIQATYQDRSGLSSVLRKYAQTKFWDKLDQKAILSKIEIVEALIAVKQTILNDHELNVKWNTRQLDNQIEDMKKRADLAEQAAREAEALAKKKKFEKVMAKMKKEEMEIKEAKDEVEEILEGYAKDLKVKTAGVEGEFEIMKIVLPKYEEIEKQYGKERAEEFLRVLYEKKIISFKR